MLPFFIVHFPISVVQYTYRELLMKISRTDLILNEFKRVFPSAACTMCLGELTGNGTNSEFRSIRNKGYILENEPKAECTKCNKKTNRKRLANLQPTNQPKKREGIPAEVYAYFKSAKKCELTGISLSEKNREIDHRLPFELFGEPKRPESGITTEWINTYFMPLSREGNTKKREVIQRFKKTGQLPKGDVSEMINFGTDSWDNNFWSYPNKWRTQLNDKLTNIL